MEEKTTEMISYIIKNKKYPMLVCPQCKSSIIQITSLKREIITFKCPCSPCNISLPLKEFIANLENIDSSNEKCFKHKDNIANAFCAKCNLYMCDTCESYHESFQPEHQTTKQIIKTNDQCIIHKNQKKAFYCKACDLDLCELCKNSVHQEHADQVISMREYFEIAKSLVQFKSTEDLSTKYIEKIQEILGYKERQVNFLNSLINIILTMIDDINKQCKKTLQTNYDNMLLNKIVTDIFYNTNESNPIPLFSAIKNAIILTNDKTEIKPSFQAPTFGTNNVWAPQNTGWGNPSTGTTTTWGLKTTNLNNSTKQIQLESLLSTFKKEAEIYFQNSELIYTTKRMNYINPILFVQREEKLYKKKNNCFFIRPISKGNKIGKIHQILELKDGNLAVSTDDKKIKIINPLNYEIIGTLIGHNLLTTSLCQLSNGNLLSGAGNSFGQYTQNIGESIKEWSLQTFECVRVISNFPGNIGCIKQLKNGNVLICSQSSSTLFIIDIATLDIKYSYCPTQTLSNIFLVIDTPSLIVSCSLWNSTNQRQYIKIWDIEKKTLHGELQRTSQLLSIHEIKRKTQLVIVDLKAITIFNYITLTQELTFIFDPNNPTRPPTTGFHGAIPHPAPINGVENANLMNRGLCSRTSFTTFGGNNYKNSCMINDELIAIGNSKGTIDVYNIDTLQKQITISTNSKIYVMENIFKMKNGKIIATSGLTINELN